MQSPSRSRAPLSIKYFNSLPAVRSPVHTCSCVRDRLIGLGAQISRWSLDFLTAADQIVSSEFFNGQKMTERAVWSFLHWEWFDPCSSRHALSSSSPLLVEGKPRLERLGFRHGRGAALQISEERLELFVVFIFFIACSVLSSTTAEFRAGFTPDLLSSLPGLTPTLRTFIFFLPSINTEADCLIYPVVYCLLVGWLIGVSINTLEKR